MVSRIVGDAISDVIFGKVNPGANCRWLFLRMWDKYQEFITTIKTCILLMVSGFKIPVQLSRCIQWSFVPLLWWSKLHFFVYGTLRTSFTNLKAIKASPFLWMFPIRKISEQRKSDVYQNVVGSVTRPVKNWKDFKGGNSTNQTKTVSFCDNYGGFEVLQLWLKVWLGRWRLWYNDWYQ